MKENVAWSELAKTNERLRNIEAEQTALTEEAEALVTKATSLDTLLGADTSDARPAQPE